MKKVASFDGTKINYDIKRSKGDLFLVFIHGAGGDLTAWKTERKYFHKIGYQTLAIDLRGHGLSDRPTKASQYQLESFAKDIKAVLDTEKITNFIMIAHCFGGMVTMEFQKLYPDLAQKYILIDTTSKAPQKLRAVLLLHYPVLPIFNFILQSKFLNQNEPNHANFDKFIGTGDWNLHRMYSDISHTSLRSWLFTYQQIARFDGREILKNIKIPVLIIHGEEDKVFGIKEAKEINELIFESVLDIVPKTNHIIVINDPKILSERIATFLARS